MGKWLVDVGGRVSEGKGICVVELVTLFIMSSSGSR